jgi:hypothetical protein
MSTIATIANCTITNCPVKGPIAVFGFPTPSQYDARCKSAANHGKFKAYNVDGVPMRAITGTGTGVTKFIVPNTCTGSVLAFAVGSLDNLKEWVVGESFQISEVKDLKVFGLVEDGVVAKVPTCAQTVAYMEVIGQQKILVRVQVGEVRMVAVKSRTTLIVRFYEDCTTPSPNLSAKPLFVMGQAASLAHWAEVKGLL